MIHAAFLLAALLLPRLSDPSGSRTAVTNGTNVVRFVADPNGAQVLMRMANGVTNYYVYGAGLLYEVRETTNSTNTLVYHYDLRGSTVALTDGGGAVRDRLEYSPYRRLSFSVLQKGLLWSTTNSALPFTRTWE